MTSRNPLKNPALWVVVGVLMVSAGGFGYALSALKITLRKLPIVAEHGIVTSDIPDRTASWERHRDAKGVEVPDRRENAEIEKTLGTTNYVTRAYVERHPKNPSRPNLMELHLAYYTGQIDTVPHVPDRCFVGGGMQIGNIVGDVTMHFDQSAWQLDDRVPEGLKPLYKVFVPGDPPFGGEYVRLCRDADKIQLRTMKFLAGEGVGLYAGYFFVANGGHTASPEGVRGLAFQMTSTYAYYMKVQLTSSTCQSPEEFVEASSSLIGELMGPIMRVTPDWVRVLNGEWPPRAGAGTRQRSRAWARDGAPHEIGLWTAKTKGTAMASKVNTKFVVGLVVGAAVVFAVVAIAYVKLVQNTPERLVAAGDAQLKLAKAKRDAGDAEASVKAVEKAIVFYSKAVNKQQTNVELLKKWDEGLREYAPANRDQYQKAFRDDFMLIRRQTAVLLKTDVQAHRDYLDVMYKQTNNATVSPESLVRVTDEMLQYFDLATDPAEKAKRDGILRYRGIALAHQAMQIDDTPAETFTKARGDLEAALRYDPKDAEAAEALYSLGIVEADRATKLVKTEEAAAARARSDALAQKFLSDNPRNPMLTLAVTRTKFVDRLRDLRKVVAVTDRKGAEAAFRAEMLPVLEDTVAAFEAADPAKLPPNLLPALAQMEATIDRAGNLKRTVALVKRLAEAKPGDAEVSLYVAEFASRSGDFSRAIAEAQKVEASPVKPIGLEGIQLFGMKRAAAGQAAGWAMDLVETAGKDADRAKLLENAKQLRDLYAGYVESSDPALKLVNGRLAFAEGRIGEASRLFKEYNEAVRDTEVRGLLYAAMSAMSQASPNTGYAKERLRRILSMDPENILAMIQLARVAILEQDLPSAEVALKSVLALDPENKLAQDMWNLLHNDGSAQSDPVVVAIRDALVKVSSGKEGEAIGDLRRALADHPGEVRIMQALTQQLVWSGDRAGALEVVEAGLKAKPDEVTLQQLKTVLTSKDPLETDITLINQADAPRLLKLIRLHLAYKTYGKETEALAQLETAEKEFPDAPELVETRFIWAVGHEQWEVANKTLEKAIAGNLDNADGLTFKSRLQAARGQVSDAIASAEAALAKVPANPEMYRLLGKLLGMQNRLGESIAAFKNAVDARPTDAAANKDYVAALLSAGRTQEALDQCRKNPRVSGSDRELTSMWMNLEARYGDRKSAVLTRERIYHSDPLQRDNALALAELYVGDARYADAMKLVDEARAHEDGLDVANIEAMCLDAQKKPEEVANVFKRLIASTDALKSMDASLTLSRYLISRGDVDAGIAVMEAARARQDPKIAEIDRAMAQMFQQLGMLDRAVESARKVVAATGDASGVFRKEIVRMLLRVGKFDEADQEYAGLVPLEPKDPDVLLLKSDTKLARGDKEAARFILDDAVARFSQQPVVFNVRATYSMRVTGQYRDAVSDLTKSLSLNPMQPSVLMSRAQCYVALGQQDEALADLERLARLTPADPVARRTLLANRLDMGQTDKAVEDGVDLLKLNNGSAAVASEFGALFGTGYGKWDEASKFYKLAFDSGKSPDAAAELVVSYVKQTPPKLNDAGTIINQMGTEIPKHWPLLLARARWQRAGR